MTVLYDVHTLTDPVQHYQQYPDPGQAHRAATRHAAVLHKALTVAPVEDNAAPAPAGSAAEARP